MGWIKYLVTLCSWCFADNAGVGLVMSYNIHVGLARLLRTFYITLASSELDSHSINPQRSYLAL